MLHVILLCLGGINMQRRLAAVLPLLLVLVLPLVCAQKVHAIPAFSRQHKTECSTCHTIYPELNEYGQAFLKNGYVYSTKPGGEQGGKALTSAGGAAGQPESGKAGKSEGLLLAGIPELLPVSFTANQTITYNEHAPDGDNWDFATRDLVLQGGGAFRELAGFFMTFDLFSHPSTSSQNGNSNLDELFMVWRRLFNTPVNIKFGKFEPKLSLWKKSDKVIVNSFATSAYKVGSSPFSMETTQDALEANAVLANRLFLVAGIVDQNGQNTKDGYGHISVKFGGTDFLGNEPQIDLETESIWDYLSVTLAGYGYAGRNADPSATQIKNNYYRVGGDMDLLYKRLRVRVSGVSGRDTNPDFLMPNSKLNSMVIASEGEYLFGSPVNVIGVFRYEYQDDGTAIIRRYIPAVAYTPLQNVKLVLEYVYEDMPTGNNRFSLLNAAFGF
jgi:hypothetical protein